MDHGNVRSEGLGSSFRSGRSFSTMMGSNGAAGSIHGNDLDVGSSEGSNGRHANNRRVPRKRKSPPFPDHSGVLPYQASNSSGGRDNIPCRPAGGHNLHRQDIGISGSNASVMYARGNPCNSRGGFHRNVRSRSADLQHFPQQHGNRFYPSFHPQARYPTFPTTLEPSAYNSHNSSSGNQGDQRVASVYNQRNYSSPAVRQGNNSYIRERAPSMLDTSSLPDDNRLLNQSGFPISQNFPATSRALNTTNRVHASQLPPNSSYYPNSAFSRSSAQFPLSFPENARHGTLHPSFPGLPLNEASRSNLNPPPSTYIYQIPGSWPPPFSNSHSERMVGPPGTSLLGMPSQMQMAPSGDRHNQRHFVSEELRILDPSLLLGSTNINDRYGDMRLDVDTMSYEELLALGERIGSVSTGLGEETISRCMTISVFCLEKLSATEGGDRKCCICQEDYADREEMGMLKCNHGYHPACISQWLSIKNQCPVCKAAAYS